MMTELRARSQRVVIMFDLITSRTSTIARHAASVLSGRRMKKCCAVDLKCRRGESSCAAASLRRGCGRAGDRRRPIWAAN